MIKRRIAIDEEKRQRTSNPAWWARHDAMREWTESARSAIRTLQAFIGNMDAVSRNDENSQHTIDSLFQPLVDQGLGGWLDSHPLDVDKLAGVLKGGDDDQD